MSNFFPSKNIPKIYAYSDTRYPGCLKVGYTTNPMDVRMKGHYPVILPSPSHVVELVELAIRENGTFFMDHVIHDRLKAKGIREVAGEWYECSIADVKASILAERKGIFNEENRSLEYTGISKHKSERVGGYDTTTTREEFEALTSHL